MYTVICHSKLCTRLYVTVSYVQGYRSQYVMYTRQGLIMIHKRAYFKTVLKIRSFGVWFAAFVYLYVDMVPGSCIRRRPLPSYHCFMLPEEYLGRSSTAS